MNIYKRTEYGAETADGLMDDDRRFSGGPLILHVPAVIVMCQNQFRDNGRTHIHRTL